MWWMEKGGTRWWNYRMKLLGAVLIILVGTVLSILPLMEMKERIRRLMVYADELRAIHAQLSTYGTSIPVLMRALCIEHTTSGLFAAISEHMDRNGAMSFSDGWKRYINEQAAFLPEQELSALLHLGDVLGKYTVEEQLSSIERVLDLLYLGIGETKSKLREVSRLYLGTGLSLSSILVILLL